MAPAVASSPCCSALHAHRPTTRPPARTN
jgi:hypothetical protein